MDTEKVLGLEYIRVTGVNDLQEEVIHPLLYPTVIRNILSLLEEDINSLKSFRQTCKNWKNEASGLLQKNSQVNIKWVTSSLCNPGENGPTLPEFMKYVDSVGPDGVFFRNYMLVDWYLHPKEKYVTEFWLQCGKHIKELELENVSFYDESFVRNILYNWTLNVEDLRFKKCKFLKGSSNYKGHMRKTVMTFTDEGDDEETISYEVVSSDSDEEDEENVTSIPTPMSVLPIQNQSDIKINFNLRKFLFEPKDEFPIFPIPWKEIFFAYPNLTDLTVFPDLRIDNQNPHVYIIKQFLVELVDFKKENPNALENLKTLDVFLLMTVKRGNYVAVTNGHFDLAAKLNFKLESLTIGETLEDESDLEEEAEDVAEPNPPDYSKILQYIRKLSPNLKVLQVNSWENQIPLFPSSTTTSFPRLTKLRLPLASLGWNDLEFIRFVPKLKILELGRFFNQQDGAITEPKLISNTVTLTPFPTLKSLCVSNDILTVDCIRKIGQWFSKLTQFEGMLDNNRLLAVYEHLNKDLEVLVVRGVGITDEGITGRKNAEEQEQLESSAKKFKAEDGDQYKLKKSIADMKKLRSLDITFRLGGEVDDDDDVCVLDISDDSVYNGLIKLTNLRSLTLSYSLITENVLRDLCDQVGILNLNTPDFYRGHEQEQRNKFLDWSRIKI